MRESLAEQKPFSLRLPMTHWISRHTTSPALHEITFGSMHPLRIILLAGFLLHAFLSVAGFAHVSGPLALPPSTLLLGGALSCLLGGALSLIRPREAAVFLLGLMYTAAWLLYRLAGQVEILYPGVLLLDVAPLIALIFLGKRSAMLCMLVNVLPFWLTLPAASAGTVLDWWDAGVQMHTMLFIVFNLAVPLAVCRILHALDAATLRFQSLSHELHACRAQYDEIFENAGSALVLTDAYGKILQANQLANALLVRHPHTDPGSILFDWLSLDNSVRLTAANGDESASMRTAAYRNRDGRMISMENIAQTQSDHYLVSLRDVSGLYSMHSALALSREREDYLSSHDRLTKLPNRDRLREYLRGLLSGNQDFNGTALVSFRLNSIRHANQKLGVHAGDQMLQRFAEELVHALPAGTFCARLRSIVFSFVLDASRSPSEITHMVEKIRQYLPREMEIDDTSLLVQFSAGIALARSDETDPDDLIRRSEVALDAARRSSDQSATLFDEDDAAQIRRSVEIEVGIAKGLIQSEFRVVYQPKVDQTGAWVGMEALLRWDSPVLGKVSPAEFIPVAESTNQIRQLSQFVLDEVCRQVEDWRTRFGHCPSVAINLSATDMARPDLLDWIEASSHKHHLSAGFLEFEITETGLIANEALAAHHLHALKARGYGIAIDDFGTGYSSLSKLSHFPAKSVKIDRSFVAQIGANPKSEMIIKAIVSLARVLSCHTVAEGVESDVQEAFLRAIGCESFQGYRYHRPLEATQIEGLLMSASLFAQDTGAVAHGAFRAPEEISVSEPLVRTGAIHSAP